MKNNVVKKTMNVWKKSGLILGMSCLLCAGCGTQKANMQVEETIETVQIEASEESVESLVENETEEIETEEIEIEEIETEEIETEEIEIEEVETEEINIEEIMRERLEKEKDDDIMVFQKKEDLDGDGKEDTILLKVLDDESAYLNYFILSVNGQEQFDWVENFFGEIEIYQIGNKKAIAVQSSGASADPVYLFYTYLNGELVYSGALCDYVEQENISEDGIITVTYSKYYFESAGVIYQYQMNEEGLLTQVQQDAYPLNGGTKKLLCELPLYDAPNGNQFVIQPQDVTIVKISADEQWIYVEYEGGAGWMKLHYELDDDGKMRVKFDRPIDGVDKTIQEIFDESTLYFYG